MLSIPYCQLKIEAAGQRIEWLSFVEPNHGPKRRFARLVGRSVSITAVAAYTGSAWRIAKAVDECALASVLSPLECGVLMHLWVLAVAKAERPEDQNYLAAIYVQDSGDLGCVTGGRGAKHSDANVPDSKQDQYACNPRPSVLTVFSGYDLCPCKSLTIRTVHSKISQ